MCFWVYMRIHRLPYICCMSASFCVSFHLHVACDISQDYFKDSLGQAFLFERIRILSIPTNEVFVSFLTMVSISLLVFILRMSEHDHPFCSTFCLWISRPRNSHIFICLSTGTGSVWGAVTGHGLHTWCENWGMCYDWICRKHQQIAIGC